MNKKEITTIALSIVGAIFVGFGAAIVAAIVLAIADIYMSGHGLTTLSLPWINYTFVHLSRADAILLVVFAISALFAGVGIYLYRIRQAASKSRAP